MIHAICFRPHCVAPPAVSRYFWVSMLLHAFDAHAQFMMSQVTEW